MKWSLGKLVLGKPGSFGVFFVFFFFWKKSIFLNTLKWKSSCGTRVKNIDVQLHSKELVTLMFVRKHPDDRLLGKGTFCYNRQQKFAAFREPI